jgi:hypothetical protein
LAARLHGDIVQQSCAVFVGAGSTTERKYLRSSFFQRIKEKAGYTGKECSFPHLMQLFCDKLDGGHHNLLIREAISYIELFSLPGEKNHVATMFSDSLAEISYFNRFVTTNWDPFIERSLDVLGPIVEDRDLAFWDDRKKQVLKIHGCITRPYSIVATQTDYDTCMSQNPLIFNKLKDLMATKTFIFVGYSMRDADFREVWQTILHSLGHFAKLAYAVDPDATAENIAYWRERGIEIFKTTDIMFVRTLRKRLEMEGLIPSEGFLQFLRRQRRRIVPIHIGLDQATDGGMASAMYQDGLMHELDDVMSSTALGIKRNEDFESDLSWAAKQLKEARKERDLIEIAHWSGRHEAVKRFCERDESSVPFYFHPYKLSPILKFVKGR